MDRKLSVFFSLIISLFFCMGSQAAFARPIEVKFAHGGTGDPKVDIRQAQAIHFKSTLEKKTAGEMTLKIYHSHQLGKEATLMEAVTDNVIQLNLASMAGLFRIYPPFLLYFSPYVFKNVGVAQRVIDSPFTQQIFSGFEKKTGLKALTLTDGGVFLAITNDKRPIKSIEDFKGLKMRGMDTLQVNMFKSFGASGVTISFAELFTSLQTGVVDGQTNPLFIVNFLKLNEVQKYLTIANSQYGYDVLICNKKWFDGLSSGQQEAVLTAAKSVKQTGRGWGPVVDYMGLEAIKKSGMKINYMAEEEIVKLQKLARPACIDWLKTKMDPKLVDDFLRVIKDIESR